MIHYRCPKCKENLTASPGESGSVIDCPHCGQKLRVPASPTSIRTTPESPGPTEAITTEERDEIRQDELPRRRRPPDYDDDIDSERDRPRRRNAPSIEPTDFLVPTNVSRWSIAACYFGLIGFCLPMVGLLFAVPALVFGIVALSKRSKKVSYGSVTSDIRAILGIIFSSLAILVWGAILILIIVEQIRR